MLGKDSPLSAFTLFTHGLPHAGRALPMHFLPPDKTKTKHLSKLFVLSSRTRETPWDYNYTKYSDRTKNLSA